MLLKCCDGPLREKGFLIPGGSFGMMLTFLSAVESHTKNDLIFPVIESFVDQCAEKTPIYVHTDKKHPFGRPGDLATQPECHACQFLACHVGKSFSSQLNHHMFSLLSHRLDREPKKYQLEIGESLSEITTIQLSSSKTPQERREGDLLFHESILWSVFQEWIQVWQPQFGKDYPLSDVFIHEVRDFSTKLVDISFAKLAPEAERVDI